MISLVRTMRPPSATVPRAARSARTASRAGPVEGVGRVQEDQVELPQVRPGGPAPTSRRTTCARSDSFDRSRFSRIVRTASAEESTNTARSAPRERASMPTAPVPANRSRTAAPATAAPQRGEQALASPVGQGPGPVGHRRQPDAARRPGDDPHPPRAAISCGTATRAPPRRSCRGAADSSSGWSASSSSCVDHREGAGAGPLHERRVVGQARQLQVGHARLLDVEQRSLAAQPEVLVGELESVVRPDHRVEPRLARRGCRSCCSSNRTQ